MTGNCIFDLVLANIVFYKSAILLIFKVVFTESVRHSLVQRDYSRVHY